MLTQEQLIETLKYRLDKADKDIKELRQENRILKRELDNIKGMIGTYGYEGL